MSVNFALCNSCTPGFLFTRKKKESAKAKTTKEVVEGPLRLASVLVVPAKHLKVTGLMESTHLELCDLWVIDSNNRLLSATGTTLERFLDRSMMLGEDVFTQTTEAFRSVFGVVLKNSLKGKRMKFALVANNLSMLATTFPIWVTKKEVIGVVVVLQPTASLKGVSPSASVFDADNSSDTSTPVKANDDLDEVVEGVVIAQQ